MKDILQIGLLTEQVEGFYNFLMRVHKALDDKSISSLVYGDICDELRQKAFELTGFESDDIDTFIDKAEIALLYINRKQKGNVSLHEKTVILESVIVCTMLGVF